MTNHDRIDPFVSGWSQASLPTVNFGRYSCWLALLHWRIVAVGDEGDGMRLRRSRRAPAISSSALRSITSRSTGGYNASHHSSPTPPCLAATRWVTVGITRVTRTEVPSGDAFVEWLDRQWSEHDRHLIKLAAADHLA